MTIEGYGGARVVVNVPPARPDRRAAIELDARAVGGDFCVGVVLDENHATALALALQAAVAEIQARAVSR